VRGREPGVKLERFGASTTFARWAKEIIDACRPFAARMDALGGGSAHAEACEEMAQRVADPQITPSARVLHAMARNHDNSYARFVLVESTLHKAMLQHLELPREVRDQFSRLAAESLQKQREIEAADQADFETFRERYLAPDLLRV
jgi:glutamate--cysteine ligase